MKAWFQKNYKTIITLSFLIPIITVAVVSISHVTQWYGISNPFTWAIYLSVGIEIAALSALAAISANMGNKIYFPFGIVTLIQFMGNIFFAYSFIDVTASSFKSWVELVSPLLEMTGVEPTDFIGHKRFLAFLSGGMLPLISLSFLHMLVKFSEEEKQVKLPVDDKKEENIEKIDASDLIGEISRVRLSEEDLALLEERLLRTKQKEDYEKLQKASLKDEVTLNDEEIMERAQKIEFKRIAERMKRIGEIQNEIRGNEDNSDDPVGALANSEYRLKDEEDEELIKMKNDYFKRQAQYIKEKEENIVNLDKQDEVLKKIESWESNEIDLTDEEIDQAIAEFNELEMLETLEESSPEPYLKAIELLEKLENEKIEQMYSIGEEDEIPEVDESWDVGVDPIDKDDEPVYQTESKELDNMLNIVDEVIEEKKK
jgi:hypothetical protein